MILTRSVDTLSGLAPLLRVRPELQQVCRFGAQWASDHAAEAGRWAPFHFVTQGARVIDLSGTERSIPLFAGETLPYCRMGPATPCGGQPHGPARAGHSASTRVALASSTLSPILTASLRRSLYAVDCVSSSRTTTSCSRRCPTLSWFPPPPADLPHRA